MRRCCETPTELTNALINDEVDALVNSYIRIPEDEKTVENFGETPYYIVVRREDTALTEQLDYAIGRMNEALPNWRTELYNITARRRMRASSPPTSWRCWASCAQTARSCAR